MTFKKKAIISACTIVAILVIAVVSVITIFASNSLTIQTNVNVGYTSTVVGASYSFGYKNADEGDGAFYMVDQDVAINSVGSEPGYNTSEGLSESNVPLSVDNQYFIVMWTIENTGSEDFTATLNYTDTGDADSNITIAVYAAKTDITNESQISTPINKGTQTYVDSVTLSESDVLYVYVKIGVEELKDNAEITGDFAWTLENIN